MPSRTVAGPSIALLALLVVGGGGCGAGTAPDRQELIKSARDAFLVGDLAAGEAAIARAARDTRADDTSEDAWSVRLLEPELNLEQGKPDAAMQRLDALQIPASAPPWARAQQVFLRARAERDRGNPTRAVELLHEARAAAPADSLIRLKIDWLEGQSLLRLEQWDKGDAMLMEVVRQASTDDSRPLLAQVLNDLGMSNYRRDRFDQALTWLERVLALSDLERSTIYASAMSNAGLCYSRLGLRDRAIDLQERAIEIHRRRGPSSQLAQALGGLGMSLQLAGESARALPYLREALDLARQVNKPDDAADWAGNLAAVYVKLGQWDEAERYNRLRSELSGPAAPVLPRSLIVSAGVARGRGDLAAAQALLQQARDAPNATAVARLTTFASLADIALAERQSRKAFDYYSAALSEIEKMRVEVDKPDYKLSIVPSRAEVYQGLVELLADQANPNRALEMVDSFRGRVLAERQRLGAPARVTLAAFEAVARRTRTVLLSYWLAPKRSFLWVVTGSGTRRLDLPPAAEIEDAVAKYRTMVDTSTIDPLARDDTPGDRLYRMLVAPAALPRHASVVIVPDGALSSINFETLPVDGPTRHYWIEDAEVQIAPSLALLTASRRSPSRTPQLLLIGNPTPREPEFPALRYAPTEMTSIVRQFPRAQVTAYDEARATPAVYREGTLDRFSMIHFTAHATANIESPLDSAVVLSGSDSGYKLYARDVADKSLTADLVTVSACRSAGERTYAGEGLVGFAWAFLRAGAQRVIAGLWDVDDRSTARLMDTLYGGIKDGRTASQALRAAKLALIHEGQQAARPYYWGPFQIFTVAP